MATYQSKYTGAEIDAGIDAASNAATQEYVDNAIANISLASGKDGVDGKDGVGIASIEKTGTSGLVDTYTITLTNGNTYTFTVTNGADGSGGDGSGDMLKSVYDTDNDGIVDDSEKLGGKTPDEYASANHTHSEYLTDYTETDPTVPDWAKTENKPEYTASEVGAAPTEHMHDVFAVGAAGFVPAPASDDSAKFLRGDGTWVEVSSSRIFYGTESERDAFTAEEGDIWFVVE